RKLVKEELLADAEQYGDARRSRIVERAAAQAISEADLVTSEPVTVVLSQRGWVRAAKGHEVDPEALSYKTGDAFQAAARGKSTQQAVFLDSTGRVYSLIAHSLPSARGQGEPLSGRIDPPEGATFAGVLIGEPDDRWVIASDAGYGFVVRLGELHSRNRAGKAVLKIPQGAGVLAPAPVTSDDALLCVVSSDGKLLAFPVEDLPELPRGKGNNIFGLSSKKVANREEYLVGLAVVAPDQSLIVRSGERKMTLKFADLNDYRGERAQRGAVDRKSDV